MYGKFNESQDQLHQAGESLMKLGPEDFLQSLKNLSEQRMNYSGQQVAPSTVFDVGAIDAEVKEESDEKQPLKNFEYLQNKLYVSVDYLLKNPQQVLTELQPKQSKPLQQPTLQQLTVPTSIFEQRAPVPFLQQSKLQASGSINDDVTEKRTRKENAYKWTADRHLRFAIVTMALGVKDCKPKHIMAFYEQMDVDRAVISSHLQKIRNVIIKQYNLQTLEDVKNWMIPKDIESPILNQIKAAWENADFTGYQANTIWQFLTGL